MPRKKSSKRDKHPSLIVKTQRLFSFFAAIVLIVAGFVLLNTYLSVKYPKQDFKIAQGEESVTLLQNGSIKVDQDLMRMENSSIPPSRIIMPSVSIDLNVVESAVKNGYWEISETTASHGMGSANPGINGNTVIFAHARSGLFYNLKEIKKNDIVYVLTDNEWYAYKVIDITSVYPDQIEVIAPTKDQTLTLYTCTGYADEKRLIVTAKPVGYSL